MKKRVLGIVTAVLVLLTTVSMLFVMPVGAADAATVTVGSVSGKVGDVVEVPVSIAGGSFLVNADMTVTFDPTKLALDDTYFVDELGEEGDTCCYQVNTSLFNSRWMYLGNERAAGEFVFSAATGSNTGLEAGGVMFTLAFKILSEESDGAVVSFAAGPFCGNDGAGEIGADGYPMDYDLAYTAVNGMVTVAEETTTTTTTKPQPVGLLGDMNADGQLNMFDAILLFGGANGARELTAEQKALADYNCDGVINMMDPLLLFRKVSGY